MNAVVIPVTFNDRSTAESELPGLLSQVSTMPGFVSGYWVALPEDKGIAMVMFDSEDSAQALADMAKSAPAGGVTTGSVEVGEVIAHA
jgi:hypothetical protein